MTRLALVTLAALLPALIPGAVHADVPGVRGTEGNLIREETPRDDGIRHTDTPAMISALKALDANTYVFPMAGDNVQWEDLREEFLPAAAKAGIKVWVLVYAPSQQGCCVSRPFKHDYVAWSREIATLSKSHPNLAGWTVDDYAYDTKKTFTPAYVKQMRNAAKAVNPALKFIPTVYYHQFTDDLHHHQGRDVVRSRAHGPADARRDQAHGHLLPPGQPRLRNPAGHHRKQLLVNGKPVWQRDVTADAANTWAKATIDLTDELAGRTSAKLQWRLHQAKGVTDYAVDVSVDDIALTGIQLSDPGVENAATWTSGLIRQGGPVYCSAQVYHRDYGADLRERLAGLYGG